MAEPTKPIVWAPRLPRALIRRLYETDAQGIYDQELLDEVGYALLARCESFVAAVEAVHGRALCHGCGAIIAHHARPDELLLCPACGWQVTWRDYFATIQHKQLSGAEPILAVYRDYIARFPAASSPQEKMRLIDWVIHNFHTNLGYGETRANGVNLIEGNYRQVLEFLDALTYGERSTPGLRETQAEWRNTTDRVARLWNDQRWLNRRTKTQSEGD